MQGKDAQSVNDCRHLCFFYRVKLLKGRKDSRLIRLAGVNKYFGSNHVLKDISLTVKSGEKLVVIGPSGSGKSTMIRCMEKYDGRYC